MFVFKCFGRSGFTLTPWIALPVCAVLIALVLLVLNRFDGKLFRRVKG